MTYYSIEQKTWRLIGVLLSILLSLPIVFILSNVDAQFFQTLIAAIGEEYTINTILLLIGTALLSLILGVSTAWFCSRFSFPLVKLFSWMLILPLAIPSYILAYTYKGIFGLFGTYHALFGSYFEVDNIFMLCFIMAMSLFPYVYLSSRVSFLMSSNKYIESARSLGKGNWHVFFRVVLPLSWPAIFAGLILVMMEVLNNYGAVAYFGVSTFTTEIVRYWNPSNTAQIQSVISILIVLVALIFFLEHRLSKRMRFTDQVQSKHDHAAEEVDVVRRTAMFTWCFIILFFAFVLPFIQLGIWALDKWELIFTEEIMGALTTTFVLGGTVALMLTLISFCIRFYTYHNEGDRILKVLSGIPRLGYAIPGALLGVGILGILFYVGQVAGVNLTSSLLVLAFAYLIRFYSVSMGTVNGGIEKIKPNLAWSSFSMGNSLSRTFGKIHFPLMRSVLLASMILVFVDVIKELPLTMMFQRFNFQTLAIKSYMLMETDGAIYDAALPSMLIVVISAIPIYFVNRMLRK